MSQRRWVWHFADAPPQDCLDLKALLGGKGASLKEMTRAGLRVPPGFTIVTDACRRYFDLGRRWPDGLEAQVRDAVARLESETGQTFGRGRRPLLVSVRSGAAVSMPGMMDTLLNCGLHPGLANDVGDTPAYWGLYIQFIHMFAATVHGLGREAFTSCDAAVGGDDQCDEPDTVAPPTCAAAEAQLRLYEQKTGQPFPVDPWDALVQCINAVFQSWQNQRAIAYRQRHDIAGLAGTAVSVQAMFPSQVSGIVFTQDPNNLPAGQMVIEASYGLGEAIVSGEVTPDRFTVNRDDPAAVQTALGHKASVVAALGAQRPVDPDAPCLTGEQLGELSELALRVEAYFGHPVDIEWGLADGQFALLQARAIRGLEIAQDVERGRLEEIKRLRAMIGVRRTGGAGRSGRNENGGGRSSGGGASGDGGGRRHVWVTHNLSETLRTPTPLTWDIVRRFMSGSGGFGRMYRQLGYRPSPQVCRDGFLELICGRIYADPDRLAQLFWDGMPLTYDMDSLVAQRGAAALDHAPDKFDPNRADGRFLAKLPANMVAMWRASRRMKRARAQARQRFEDVVLPLYLRYVDEKRREDLAALSDEQVIGQLHDRCARVLDDFGGESLKPGFFGGLAFDAVESMLVQLMGNDEGEALAQTLTRGLEGDTTFEQDAMLYRVAKGEASMPQFIERFGHRCVNEMELSQRRWRQNPAYLEQTAARLRQHTGRGPADIHHDNVERRLAARANLAATLKRWGGSSFAEQIERDLADACALLPYRESGKHYLMMGYELIRTAIEELSRRWDLGDRVYMLNVHELGQFTRDRKGFADEIERRRTRWLAMQRLDMPDVIDSDRLDELGLAVAIEAADELEGTAVAPGVASGSVRIVFDPQRAGDLGPDYVLVCPSTDPGWTPLFMDARALVVEKGGVLSHGAIVARDFGIPAVVCPNATKQLSSGDRVRVDGNVGRIAVIERAEAHA